MVGSTCWRRHHLSSRPFRRGEVYWIRFPAGIGSEIQKTRPAVIVSNNTSNRALSRLQVIPLTSNTARVYPGETIVTLVGSQNKAMANQIQTIAKERVERFIGRLSEPDMLSVNSAITTQLGL